MRLSLAKNWEWKWREEVTSGQKLLRASVLSKGSHLLASVITEAHVQMESVSAEIPEWLQ